MKRFCILIEDDFEVMGNGLGSVRQLQHEPATRLMEIAERNGVKLTFMVDVAHRLELEKHKNAFNIQQDIELWDATILSMKARGFDVQLHLHPQWLDAKYRDGFFYLNDNWNLACYPEEVQAKLVQSSVRFLEGLIKPYHYDYKICAFKGGSWGLQPSGHLLKILCENGVRIVLGVRDGLYVPKASIDYRILKEKYLPYHPDWEEIRKPSQDKRLLVIPLQPYASSLWMFSKLALDQLKNRIKRKRDQRSSGIKIPLEIQQLKPLSGKKAFRFSLRPYQTHLKLGHQPFSYLKASFDFVIRRLRRLDKDRIPILIESHTKQYIYHYEDIERFFDYVLNQYGAEVEFSSLTEYCGEAFEEAKISKAPTGKR